MVTLAVRCVCSFYVLLFCVGLKLIDFVLDDVMVIDGILLLIVLSSSFTTKWTNFCFGLRSNPGYARTTSKLRRLCL